MRAMRGWPDVSLSDSALGRRGTPLRVAPTRRDACAPSACSPGESPLRAIPAAQAWRTLSTADPAAPDRLTNEH